MSVEIKVPVLPESVADATVAMWHKKPGEMVSRDENLVDIETDKVILEVVAPADGVIEEILKPQGSTVKAEEVIGRFTVKAREENAESKAEPKLEAKPEVKVEENAPTTEPALSPSARRAVQESQVNVESIKGTGKDGRITKQDVESYVVPEKPAMTSVDASAGRLEKRVPMSRLRAKIAERLLSAQHGAAILTTFNEINMQPVMALRAKYKDDFEQKYGVRLGFMSFFVTAAVAALKRFPAVNASIDGADIVYHGYFDIGIAVGSPRGLIPYQWLK
jgi:2-oxoglutarate dehydrogenase E2 component (dihydrolipoamide succinyltransferase)